MQHAGRGAVGLVAAALAWAIPVPAQAFPPKAAPKWVNSRPSWATQGSGSKWSTPAPGFGLAGSAAAKVATVTAKGSATQAVQTVKGAQVKPSAAPRPGSTAARPHAGQRTADAPRPVPAARRNGTTLGKVGQGTCVVKRRVEHENGSIVIEPLAAPEPPAATAAPEAAPVKPRAKNPFYFHSAPDVKKAGTPSP